MRYPLLVSLFVVLIAAIVLIAFDCWLMAKGGTRATISWHLYLAAKHEPIIPALFGMIVGILFGHFFWPNNGK